MESFLLSGLGSIAGSVAAATKKFRAKARGWSEYIDWVPLKEGLKLAKEENKCLMVVAHKESCSSCASLKYHFSHDPEIHKLSEKFVMVNLEPDEVPMEKDFAPDGHYVPRVMFFNPQGKLLPVGANETKHVYYYANKNKVKNSMVRVLENYSKKDKSTEKKIDAKQSEPQP